MLSIQETLAHPQLDPTEYMQLQGQLAAQMGTTVQFSWPVITPFISGHLP